MEKAMFITIILLCVGFALYTNHFGFNKDDNLVSEDKGEKTEFNRGTKKATFAGGCFWCMEPCSRQNV